MPPHIHVRILVALMVLRSALGVAVAGHGFVELDTPPPGLSSFVGTAGSTRPVLDVVYTKPTGDMPQTVTRVQALVDVGLARRYLHVGYSGYDYFASLGFDFDEHFRAVRAWVLQAPDAVPVDELAERLGRGLQALEDRHLAVMGRRVYRCCPHQKAYFADILVDRSGSDLVVTGSRVAGITSGMRYTGPETYLFPTLSRPDSPRYLLGTLAAAPPAALELSFDSSLRSVPVHRCRLARYNSEPSGVVTTSTVEGVPVVSAVSFSPETTAEVQALADFGVLGAAMATTPAFVLDLCGNGGGSDRYAVKFIGRLDGGIRLTFPSARLESPLTGHPSRRWTYQLPLVLGSPGHYEGRVVVLTNKAVASAAEVAVHMVRNLRSAVVVGENTSGCDAFGGAEVVSLPASNIRLSISTLVKPEEARPEGVGYRPDYWVDKDSPLADVAAWLTAGETYEYELP